jgi:hypothetical protein
MAGFLYTVSLLTLLSFCFLVLAHIYLNFYIHFIGAPFVPTSDKMLDEILKEARLKKGKRFIELGSGDGRVVIKAGREYGVSGKGVELNPFLYYLANILTRVKGVRNVSFRMGNFYKSDIKDADYIFLFLLPKSVEKLGKKIDKECKRGTLVISHAFKIKGFEEKLIKIQERKSYSTYFYKI